MVKRLLSMICTRSGVRVPVLPFFAAFGFIVVNSALSRLSFYSLNSPTLDALKFSRIGRGKLYSLFSHSKLLLFGSLFANSALPRLSFYSMNSPRLDALKFS